MPSQAAVDAGPPKRARTRPQNPLRKTTVNLLKTFKRINEIYYARRKLNQLWTSDVGVDNSTDYEPRKGELLLQRYEVQSNEPLGMGTYGIVVKAFDVKTQSFCAIKISRDNEFYHAQARVEKWLLEKFMELDGHNHGIVELLDCFMLETRQCLVFELMDATLYDVIKNRNFRGLPLHEVQQVAIRALSALEFLARPDIDVIHADIKPENLLVPVNQNMQNVKVIDFGSSCRANENMQTYVQSRFYRAPEVLLGLRYSQSIDVWSLGCTLCELYTGRPLFNGYDEVDQLVKIVEVVGLPPSHMVVEALERQARRHNAGSGHLPQLPSKCASLFELDPKPPSGGSSAGYRLTRAMNARVHSIDSIVGSTTASGQRVLALFADLLRGMLRIDPEQRLTPSQALDHDLFRERLS